MRGFRLSKWYLDCMADDGSAMIGYWARLRLGSMHVHYAAALVSARGAAFRQISSIRTSHAPDSRDGVCTWNCDSLRLRGTWRARAPAFRKTLLKSAHGDIRWWVIQPASDAQVTISGADTDGQALELSGYGYVEKLELTVPPWHLPFDMLYWGRFVSEEHALVWLEWRATRGKNRGSRRRFAVLNGKGFDRPSISDERICLGEAGELQLCRPHTIRQGQLASTVTRAIPGLNRLLPTSFSRMCELKQRYRGVLRLRGQQPSSGWAIHEVVQW